MKAFATILCAACFVLLGGCAGGAAPSSAGGGSAASGGSGSGVTVFGTIDTSVSGYRSQSR